MWGIPRVISGSVTGSLGVWQDKYFLCNYTSIIRILQSVKSIWGSSLLSSWILFLFVAWRALTHLKLNLFYIHELQCGKTKLKGKKRKKSHMVASDWDWKDGSELRFGERQNDVCVGMQGASVLEFRLDLGLGQGQNTRLSIIVIGQPPNRPQPHSSSGKL